MSTNPSLPAPSVVLFVCDVAAMAHFYEAAAAMTRQHGDADHVVLATQGLELVVHGIPAHIAASIPIASPPVPREDTPLKLCLPVPSIAAARPLVHSLGGRLNPPAKEWSARGFRACDGVDPEGNVFQLREHDPQSGA